MKHKRVYKKTVPEPSSAVRMNEEALLKFVTQNAQDGLYSDEYDDDNNEFNSDESDGHEDEFSDGPEDFKKNLQELINSIVKKSVSKHAKEHLSNRSGKLKEHSRRFLHCSSSGMRKVSHRRDRHRDQDQDQYNKKVLDAALEIMKRKQLYKKTVPNRPLAVEENEEVFLNFVNKNAQNHFGSDKYDEDRENESSSNEFDKYDDEFVSETENVDVLNSRTLRNSVCMGVKGNPKKNGKMMAKSSRVLRSSSRKGLDTHKQETLYHNKPELDTALEVIQKVMKMDAAKPFNVPVDPVELGIPDYFDVVDTPMDFGTICSNIQNEVKYVNAVDVFKDVQCIWENCSMYNNKGAIILDLMMRVKRNFMKYWTEAGLSCEQLMKTTVSTVKKSGAMQARSSQPPAQSQPNTNSSQFQVPSPPNAISQPAALTQINATSTHAAQSHLDATSQLPYIETSNEPVNSKRRGTRGSTKLADIWNLPPWKRIPVEVGKTGEPIGAKAGLFAKFLGTVARKGQLAPLDYKDWRCMPQSLKEDMWRIVEAKFEIDHSVKNWVLKSLGIKWRGFKCHLKATVYDVHPTYEAMCANLPNQVDRNQFAALVNFWDSELGKKVSAENKKRRRDQNIRHTAGTKSFARIAAEKESNFGVEPTRAELYILTHQRKDGTAVDEESKEKIEKLEGLIAQQRESSQPLERKLEWENDVFTQLFPPGKRRCRRAFDLKPTFSAHVNSTHYHDEVLRLQGEVKTMQEKITELQTQADRVTVLEGQLARIPELEAQLGRMVSLVQRIFPEEQLSISGTAQFSRQAHAR